MAIKMEREREAGFSTVKKKHLRTAAVLQTNTAKHRRQYC